MQERHLINGIDVDALRDTIGAVKNEPTLAKTEFRADNEWVNGAHCRAHIKSFYTMGQEDTSRTQTYSFDEDEPPALLGKNIGPNPTEYALVALSGCLTTTLAVYAAAKGYKLESVTSHLEGDIDLHGFLGLSDEVRNGYQQVRVTFDIKGDVNDEQKQELIELAQKHSPVFDIVSNPVPVSVGLSPMPAQGQTEAA